MREISEIRFKSKRDIYWEANFTAAAFPQPAGEYATRPKFGLTKREYFAALAMQGLLSKDWPHDEIADEAIAVTDSLIAALQRTPIIDREKKQ